MNGIEKKKASFYNGSSRVSLRSAGSSTYEDVASRVSHITKPVLFDKVLETSSNDLPPPSETNGKIYKVNLNILPVFFLELMALGCLAALAYVLRFHENIPVLLRYINCNETSGNPINMILEGVYSDLDTETFYAICICVPIAIILFGEIVYFLFSKTKKVVRGGCISCRLYLPLRRIVRFCGIFLFGLFVNSIITDSLKLSTGRLRPNTCNNFGNLTSQEIRNTRLSFPSYFASMSSYSATYTMVYVHFILAIRASRLLRPSLVFALTALSLLCGASRVTLGYNHWDDVLVGLIIGAAIAAYLTFSTLESFGKKSQLSEAFNETMNLQNSEEKPLFFRYFRIPHVSYQNRTGIPYPEEDSSSMPPYEETIIQSGNDFQKDLHRRIDDINRRQQHI